MEPTPALIKALHRDKIESARQMTPSEKLLAGAELFDYACWITQSGIRAQHPNASNVEVLDLLRQRTRFARAARGTRMTAAEIALSVIVGP
jgi:hypothetical protein